MLSRGARKRSSKTSASPSSASMPLSSSSDYATPIAIWAISMPFGTPASLVTDAERILKKVGALRSLCVRLPHLETPAETLLLNRFDALASGPDRLTENDRDAVVVGWRRSWRAAETETVRQMVPRMDGNMVARDRSLAMLWVAATAPGWDTVQHSIWRCATCEADPRVALDVRQQTESPARPVSLLIVTLAPPFVTARRRSRAASATSNPRDAVRRFIEDALGAPTPGFRAERHQAVCRRHHGPHGLPRARTSPRNVLEPSASPGAAPTHGTAHTRGYRWCPGRPGQPLLPALRVSVHPDAAPQEGRCRNPDARRDR